MMKTRCMLLICLFLALTLAFAGCGENDGKTEGTTAALTTAGGDNAEPSDTTAQGGETEPQITTAPEKDTEPPVITVEDGKKEIKIKYGDDIDLLDGVKASDNKDKDIKINISGTVNSKVAGTYVIRYNAVDSDNNHAAEVTKTVVVVRNSLLVFIGHAGCFYGIMNSEEAFLGAVRLGYQAIECDIKQTSDGVFVVCHDDDFNGVSIASTTYENLKNVKNTVTRGGVSYTSTICTFGRYLEICKENKMTAVVELKSSKGITNTDQSRMSALMSEIKKYDMLDSVIFLGSQYNCLIWVKQNGYADIPCQYLVSSIESDTYFNRCKDNGLDVSFNIANANSEEWITRYKDAGMRVACYTFNQYQTAETLQKWIDTGVDYVTCDMLTPTDVRLPEYDEEASAAKYKVSFKDTDGRILKEITVSEGAKAVPPIDPEKPGYTFIGWDTDTSSVKKDTVVNAKYELTQYKIIYNKNNVERVKTPWADKAAFLGEFYSDFFTWLTQNADSISALTKSGDTYTLTLNGQSASFKNDADIAATDIYVFEKTFSNFIYAPVKRDSDTTPVIPVENSAYFLNSPEYRVKYSELDAYFLSACINGYSAYDRTYNPTSSGKIQIFFRFQQWAKGTKIVAFDKLPEKIAETELAGITVTLPTSPVTFTVEDTVTLQDATVSGGEFLGWFANPECDGERITVISKGTVKDILLYAKIVK